MKHLEKYLPATLQYVYANPYQEMVRVWNELKIEALTRKRKV